MENFSVDIAEAFDELRDVLLPAGATLTLLRANGGTQAYDNLTVIEAGWFQRASAFTGLTTFEIVPSTSEQELKLKRTTHIAYQTKIYDVTEGDPESETQWWKFRGRPTGEVYA